MKYKLPEEIEEAIKASVLLEMMLETYGNLLKHIQKTKGERKCYLNQNIKK